MTHLCCVLCVSLLPICKTHIVCYMCLLHMFITYTHVFIDLKDHSYMFYSHYLISSDELTGPPILSVFFLGWNAVKCFIAAADREHALAMAQL